MNPICTSPLIQRQKENRYPQLPALRMTPEGIAGFLCGFEAKGRRDGTIRSYRRILERLYQGLPEDKGLDGERLARWERGLLDSGDSPRTVNVKIAAVNSFLGYCERRDLQLRPLHPSGEEIQPELTRAEYRRLLQAAKAGGKERTYLLVKTICSTGIRLQDIPQMTVENIAQGGVTLSSGERLSLPDALRQELLDFARKTGVRSGSLFVTRSGEPMDRVNINRSIKSLCRDARVAEEKATPLCLRKLYQSTYAGIRENIDVLVEQAHTRLLEKEEENVGWNV
ncbi:MAG TPA: tyrosine-type recombinase/integrase [Firmicutes bacterium]|nr:tyrosine-type recombinase/integrase [Bacillota bacterium]